MKIHTSDGSWAAIVTETKPSYSTLRVSQEGETIELGLSISGILLTTELEPAAALSLAEWLANKTAQMVADPTAR